MYFEEYYHVDAHLVVLTQNKVNGTYTPVKNQYPVEYGMCGNKSLLNMSPEKAEQLGVAS